MADPAPWAVWRQAKLEALRPANKAASRKHRAYYQDRDKQQAASFKLQAATWKNLVLIWP